MITPAVQNVPGLTPKNKQMGDKKNSGTHKVYNDTRGHN